MNKYILLIVLLVAAQSISAQSLIAFTYGKESLKFEKFNKIEGTSNKSGTLILVNPKAAVNPLAEKNIPDFQMTFSVKKRPNPFPIEPKDSFQLSFTADQEQALKKELTNKESQAFKEERQLQIDSYKAFKDAEIRVLSERMLDGETVQRELEYAIQELNQAVDNNFTTVYSEEIKEIDHFSIQFVLPYGDNQFKKEVIVSKGVLKIITLNAGQLVATFEGQAIAYCDEKDLKNIAKASKKNKITPEGKAILEENVIKGTIKIPFDAFSNLQEK